MSRIVDELQKLYDDHILNAREEGLILGLIEHFGGEINW